MTTSSASNFRDNARQRMAELGLTYEKLGERVGMKGPNVYNYLTGARVPGLDVLDKFAEALEMSASDLLSVEEKISS